MSVPIKRGEDQKISIDMTPMIDIVFQLLSFFIFTLKISAQEGDFMIKMPLAAPRRRIWIRSRRSRFASAPVPTAPARTSS